jgi:ribosomal protein L24E
MKSIFNNDGVTNGFVIHTHPHRFTMADVPRGHGFMFVLRDPVKRFISGFESRLRKGAPANHLPWTEHEEKAFSVFPDANALALALDPEHAMHQKALSAMSAIGHLNSSYWDWFKDMGALEKRADDIVFIGRTESLDEDFEMLARYLGLPMGTMLPRDAKAGHRSDPATSRDRVFEKRAAELVREWYVRDYDLLRFCDQWRERNGGAFTSS